MKIAKLTFFAIAILFASTQVNAVPYTPNFSDYSFPGTQYTVDAAANAFFSTNYGITIDNAYLYVDSRDTFDGIGVSTGTTSEFGTTQTARINFLDTTDYATIDYWSILPTTYTAYDTLGNAFDSFSIGSDTLGTYTFSSVNLISYITWTSGTGYGQISGLSYNYDGTTDGRNTDINQVPEPSSIALMGLGLVGLGFISRKKKHV